MYVTIPTARREKARRTTLASTTTKPPQTQAKAGAYLYYEGDQVKWLFQVISGVLRLTRLLEDGRRQVIAFGYPGDIVGFPSAGMHNTDCDVLIDVRLQPYRRSSLESGEGDPKLHSELLQAALHEISAMQDHFMMLGCKSAVEKVASFLCVLSDRVGKDAGAHRQLTLPMSRSDIADFLGLTTETVSRTLTQLRKSKIIAVQNIHTIILLRPTALLGLSRGER